MRKLTYGFYGLGIFTIIVGLIFYNHVFIDNHILSYLSEFLYQRRSAYVVYIGIAVIVVAFFLSNDFIKVFVWVKNKDMTQAYTKIVIGIALILWVINILLPSTLLIYYRFLVFAGVTVYIGLKTHKLVYISILIFIAQLVDNMLFLYRYDYPQRTTWIFTTAFFIILAAMLAYIVCFIIQYIKKQNYMKYLFVFFYHVVVVALVSVERLSLSFIWSSSTGAQVSKENGYIWIELIIYVLFAVFMIVINKNKRKIEAK